MPAQRPPWASRRVARRHEDPGLRLQSGVFACLAARLPFGARTRWRSRIRPASPAPPPTSDYGPRRNRSRSQRSTSGCSWTRRQPAQGAQNTRSTAARRHPSACNVQIGGSLRGHLKALRTLAISIAAERTAARSYFVHGRRSGVNFRLCRCAPDVGRCAPRQVAPPSIPILGSEPC